MPVLSELLTLLKLTEVQLDELWAFVQKKSSSDENVGEHWIWTAIDAKTRLMVSYMVGHRTLDDARRFLKDLTSRLEGKPLFTSDELPHYETGLRDIYSDLETPERTGLAGRPQGPKQVVHEDLDYATVHKTREGGRVVQVTRQIIFGTDESVQERLNNSPSLAINTAYVERSNLSWRLWDAHLCRKSVTFAKALPWLNMTDARLFVGRSPGGLRGI
jgi:IS1 family transposase